jgi:hypothetical protein
MSGMKRSYLGRRIAVYSYLYGPEGGIASDGFEHALSEVLHIRACPGLDEQMPPEPVPELHVGCGRRSQNGDASSRIPEAICLFTANDGKQTSPVAG